MTAPLSALKDNDDVRTSSRSTGIPQEDRSRNIKVAVRFRPLWEASKRPRKIMEGDLDVIAWTTEKVGSMVSLTQKGCVRKVEGRTVFHLDQVFDEETHTLQVYQSIARPLISSVLNGKHATIFAYGQTGSGKTFTMQGEGEGGSGHAGIITMVTADLFRSIEASKVKFEIKVSYFEIYNEKIRDLLVEETSSDCNSVSTDHNDEVNIRTNVNGNIVLNAIQKRINNTDEALMMLLHGNTRRTVATTDMNALSSRSHAVFRLSVKSRVIDEHQRVNYKGHEFLKFSDFNLVDLAGSESLKATRTTGIRQREGATINKSLLALTTVIHALSQSSKKRSQHINYRDSKLTRILQPHLSGNAEMAILCCASRSKDFIEETRATLKFASRAKHVQVKPKLNKLMDDSTIIRNLQSQLHETRKKLDLAEKKLQEEVTQKVMNAEPRFDAKKATLGSSNYDDFASNEKANESLPSRSKLQSDVVNPIVTENYQSDDSDLGTSEIFMNSPHGVATNSSFEHDRLRKEKITVTSMKDNTDGSQPKDELSYFFSTTRNISFDGYEGNYSGLSLNVCSQVSNPETICGLHGVEYREKSVFRSQDPGALCPNGRLENNLSWDAVDFGTERFVHNEKTFRTIESLNDKRGHLIPGEITIIDSSMIKGNTKCLTDRLNDAEARIEFLEEKLESSDNIVEACIRDLQRARFSIRELIDRNTKLKVKLKEKGREDIKKKYEKGEIMVEQYWILKASLYCSVFFFLSGSQEYFLATAFFVWLALEMNVTA